MRPRTTTSLPFSFFLLCERSYRGDETVAKEDEERKKVRSHDYNGCLRRDPQSDKPTVWHSDVMT